MQQFTLAKQCYDGAMQASKVAQEVRSIHEKMQRARERAGAGATAESITAFENKMTEIAGAGGGGRRFGRGAPRGPDTIASVAAELTTLLRDIENADVTPSTQMAAAVRERRAALTNLLARWETLKSRDMSKLDLQ
jgi:hypothetical protein